MRILEDNLVISDNDFLWKYLDLYKFLYLVQTNKIYFSRLDKFDDPLEGLSDRIIYDKFFFDHTSTSEEPNSAIPLEQRLLNADRAKKGLKDIKEVASITQVSQYASCLYISHRESRAMWDLYSSCDSVALRFEGKELIGIIKNEAQKNTDTNYDYMIVGNVHYRDLYPPDTTIHPMTEMPNMFSVNKKDSCYAHEKEFRFVVNRKKPDTKVIGFELDFPKMSTLSFNIITHPNMGNWKYIILRKLLEKFSIDKYLSKSVIPTGL
jgi:hypothetical protein